MLFFSGAAMGSGLGFGADRLDELHVHVVAVDRPGLGGSDPVQRAFVEDHAFQCGWCTPGFVLAAKELLAENADPSDEEIAEALGGNLCRCGSYVKIADAVRSLRRPA